MLGAALVIAGGVVARGRGAELALGTGPFQWLGRRSYGWYLVHWPVLIIATEAQDKAVLPGWESVLWVVGALAVAAVLFRLVEDPIRHLRTPRLATVVAGGITVVVTVLVLTRRHRRPCDGLPVLPGRPGAQCGHRGEQRGRCTGDHQAPRWRGTLGRAWPATTSAATSSPAAASPVSSSHDAADLHAGRQECNQADGGLRRLPRADVATGPRCHRQDGPPPPGRPLPLVLPVRGGDGPRIRPATAASRQAFTACDT